MRFLVTGSSGHLGEALMRSLRSSGHDPVGVDIVPSAFTTLVGSIVDRDFVRRAMHGVSAVLHTAALHKPHVVTHSRQDFIDINLTGTLNLLDEAVRANTRAFVYTSTTSAFGDALNPAAGEPAAWVTEQVASIPKNIYGVTKAAAEDLCQLAHRNQKLPVIALRTARFFLDADDDRRIRADYSDDNVKVNEYLFRRADIEDVASSVLIAAERAAEIGFGRYIISATTPFKESDMAELRHDPVAVARRRMPQFEAVYAARSWKLPTTINRVYVNEKARTELRWQPKHDFAAILSRLKCGEDWRSELARMIGSKLYHATRFAEGPYPVEDEVTGVGTRTV